MPRFIGLDVGHDRPQGRCRFRDDGSVADRARRRTRSSSHAPGGRSRIPSCGGRPAARYSAGWATPTGSAWRVRCTAWSHSTANSARCARPSSGTTGGRRRNARRSSAGSVRTRAVAADRQSGAGRVHRAQAALDAAARAGDLRAASATSLLPKDYVRLRLTGEIATDVSDASGTLLFDVAAGGGATRCSARPRPARGRAAAAADESPRPAGRASGGVPGGRRRRRPGGGRGRHRLATGRARRRSSSDVRRRLLRTRATAPIPWPALHTFCHAGPDSWHAMGVMLSAARLAALAARRARRRRAVRRAGGRGGALAAGRGRRAFLPYLSGERTPHADPDARGAFLGLGLDTTAARSCAP